MNRKEHSSNCDAVSRRSCQMLFFDTYIKKAFFDAEKSI